MQIGFADSPRSTVGIEWEIAIVDRATGELASVADRVLDGLRGPDGSPHERITHELLTNTVELVSGVHERVDAAVADLLGQLDEVRSVLHASATTTSSAAGRTRSASGTTSN